MRFGTVDIKEGKTMIALQEFAQQLTKMQWSDYLDILVVAVLIYKIMPLIRTPNTMRIARAVLAVLIIAWVTGEMNLHTVNYILNQVLAVGVLAVWCCSSRNCGVCWTIWEICASANSSASK